MSTAAAVDDPGSGVSASQLPWQSIPRFQPGVTHVQEYSQKTLVFSTDVAEGASRFAGFSSCDDG